MGEKPKVITIIGSSKFCDIMAVVSWLLEKDEGTIVMGLHMLPRWYSEKVIPDHLAEHEGVADRMDKLHIEKIKMSDEVFCVDYNEYIGESTREELKVTEKLGIPVRWYSRDPVGMKVDGIIESAREFAAIKNDKAQVEALVKAQEV